MKNILVAVTGLTPQVVTETIFTLSRRKVTINEVFVITTERGKTVILGKDTAKNTPDTTLSVEIQKMCVKWKIPVPLFPQENIIVATEEAVGLADVRNDKHNVLFPNKTAEVIRKLAARKDSVLYCSISGGRKSMGVHLASALQVFGRENDKLLHVVASESFEATRLFYPNNAAQAKELELSEIPFVPVSPLLKETMRFLPENFTFAELTEETHKQLKLLADTSVLTVDIPARQFRSGGNIAQMEPLEIALYLVLFKHSSGERVQSAPFVFEKEFALEVQEFLSEHYNAHTLPDDKNLPKKDRKFYHDGFKPDQFRTKRSKINAKLSTLFIQKESAGSFLINSDRRYGQTSYFIAAPQFKIIIKR